MIRAAIVDPGGVVANVILLNRLDEYPGAVLCPEHVGVGMRINDPPPLPPLTDYKSKAQDAIDQAAGRARARYITVAPGQEATYQAKAAEADAYVVAGRPADTTPYPILTAEAQARGISVSDMADMVRTMRDQWTQLAAAIEGIRIGGKLAVDAAADHAGVDAARDAAIAQLEAV